MDEKKLERIIHNRFMDKNSGAYSYNDVSVIKDFFHHLVNVNDGKLNDFDLKKHKIALMFICLNEPYWEFAKDAIEGARQYFLPGHDVEIMLWTDMPNSNDKTSFEKAAQKLYALEVGRQGLTTVTEEQNKAIVDHTNIATERAYQSAQIADTVTKFEAEPIEWPYPTLLRYTLFLNQEEYLKKFDYIFYCDLDMKFVNIVGDELLGPGLTAAQHPMYALRKEYWPPYEPNPESQAYIKRPGMITQENGKPRFKPLYFAGGLQGGQGPLFLEAMRVMKKMIDTDLKNNYIPIWNDESVWNKYLFENPPNIVLSPSYVYPDSLINEYYKPVWGCDYPPKLITLTKKFTTSKEGGSQVQKMFKETKPLQ